MPTSDDAATYPFKGAFQIKLFASILRDSQFYRRFHDVLQADYFSHDLCRQGMRLVERHHDEFKCAPSLAVFPMLLEQEMAKRGGVKADIKGAWDQFIVQLADTDLADLSYIQSTAVQWAKDRVFEQAIIKLSEIVDEARSTGERKYDAARKLVADALMVGTGSDEGFADYFGTMMARMAMYHRMAGSKIPTFMLPLDKLMSGGLDRGEEGVIVASASGGKTTMMIQLGVVGSLLAGQQVLGISAEMSQLKFEMRVDRCISLMQRWEIEDDMEGAIERIEMVRRYKGNFRCYDFPSRKCSVDRIASLLDELRNRYGFIPGTIVVDYGSILQPSKGYTEKRHEVASNFRELRDLAKEYDAALWTAAQANRGAFSKEIITQADLAECYEIAAIVDFIGCICQTKIERDEGNCRLYVAKNRDDEDHKIIPLRFERQHSRFYPTHGEALKVSKVPEAA